MQCVCLNVDAAIGNSSSITSFFHECMENHDEMNDIMAIDGGESVTLAVKNNGNIIAWGTGFYGELGEFNAHDTQDNKSSLPCVRTIQLPEPCCVVACGKNHVLCLSSRGEVYAWGLNCLGQVGVDPGIETIISTPYKVHLPDMKGYQKHRFKSIAAGGSHSIALHENGRVWTWGNNEFGQLGSNTKTTSIPVECEINADVVIQSIAAGFAHSVITDSKGSVWTFGWGLYNQLGHGTITNQTIPKLVDALEGIDDGNGIVQVSCGLWHSVARTKSGDIYSWGWGKYGQLGHGEKIEMQPIPAVLDTPDRYFLLDDEGVQVVNIACGARFTIALSRNGDLHYWGELVQAIKTENSIRHKQYSRSRNIWGKLGDGKYCRHIAAGHSHIISLVQS